jgi:excisionase family DNA binding protein
VVTVERERNDPLDLLAVPELAALWRVHPATVRKWIHEGKLPAVRFGVRGRLKVTRAAAELFLAEHGLDS